MLRAALTRPAVFDRYIPCVAISEFPEDAKQVVALEPPLEQVQYFNTLSRACQALYKNSRTSTVVWR